MNWSQVTQKSIKVKRIERYSTVHVLLTNESKRDSREWMRIGRLTQRERERE